MRTHLQVLEHCEIGKNHASFGRLGDAKGDDFMGGLVCNSASLKNNRPACNLCDTGNGSQGAGFAGSIAADECHDAPGGNLERDAMQRGNAAVADMEVPNLKHGASPRPGRPR